VTGTGYLVALFITHLLAPGLAPADVEKPTKA
jgi:hypothetical protein